MISKPRSPTVASSEKEIENSILEYLNLFPDIIAWKNQSVGIYDPIKKVHRKPKSKWHVNGVSDILGIWNGRFLAIEVKTPKTIKNPPKHQVEFIALINHRGGIAFFAASIDDVKKELGERFHEQV